jgi:O-antigen ligase
MKNGLQMLSTQQYVFGAGLSSVIVAGPHNDYIRWTQRIGVLGMLLSFAPFVLALKYNLKAIMKHNKSIYFLTSSGLFFTLYHSFFEYPRDDAYQSLYVFLGLALWLAVSRVDSVHGRSERAGERGYASRNQQGASLY